MSRRIADIIAGSLAVAVYLIFCVLIPLRCPDYFADINKKITVTLAAGMSAKDAAVELQKSGVVENAALLVDAMKILGIDRTLKPGIYVLTKGTPGSVALQLKNAKPSSLKVALIPGSGFSQLAAFLGGREKLGAALADDGNFPSAVRRYLPVRSEERIMFLLPETYYLSPGRGAAVQFVQRASKLWLEKIGQEISADQTQDYVLKRGILASIVEGEAKVESDRPILAGIFLARLSRTMRLQSCATVVYCWEQTGVRKQHLSYGDLKIDSAYNTYVHDGLPPGPICVPSLQSWRSALHPQKSDYLFFFADGKGKHVFSKTYSEHLKKQKTLQP